MNEIFIPVIGIPAPQGSKRHVGNGIMIENSKRVKPWRQDVKEAALTHYDGEVIDQAIEIEIIFLFAWATRFNDLGWYGILVISIFTFFVLETLYYVWKKGVLDWNIPRRERYLKQDLTKEAA